MAVGLDGLISPLGSAKDSGPPFWAPFLAGLSFVNAWAWVGFQRWCSGRHAKRNSRRVDGPPPDETRTASLSSSARFVWPLSRPRHGGVHPCCSPGHWFECPTHAVSTARPWLTDVLGPFFSIARAVRAMCRQGAGLFGLGSAGVLDVFLFIAVIATGLGRIYLRKKEL